MRDVADIEGSLGWFKTEAPALGYDERSRLVTSIAEELMTSTSPKCLTRPQYQRVGKQRAGLPPRLASESNTS